MLAYIGQFSRGKLTMHSCVVDMEAWRDLTSHGVHIPSEIELCNQYVSQVIVAMFANNILSKSDNSPLLELYADELLNFVFDRSEPFFESFRVFINTEKE
jgi:hypothetical protein